MIRASDLLTQVRSTAPFLFAGPAPEPARDALHAASLPRGYLSVLRHSRGDEQPGTPAYFLLCCAAHHASVATYVPTDVDSKIRGRLWAGASPAVVAAQADLALALCAWTPAGISARVIALAKPAPQQAAKPAKQVAKQSARQSSMQAGGIVSGHDGEHLSILVGALGASLLAGDTARSTRLTDAIDAELAREAALFTTIAATPGGELDALRLCSVLTHNVGDVDQGLGYWPAQPALAACRERFHDLAHRPRFGGAFARAARLYAALMASEGHRNYPLRAVAALRRSPDFLLAIAPFLDAWGTRLATHPDLRDEERIELASALLIGCTKVPGQRGYQRAYAGMQAALGATWIEKRLPSAARSALASPLVQRGLAVSATAFTADLTRRARTLLDAQETAPSG